MSVRPVSFVAKFGIAFGGSVAVYARALAAIDPYAFAYFRQFGHARDLGTLGRAGW